MTDSEQIIGIVLIVILIANSVRMLIKANGIVTAAKKLKYHSGESVSVDVSGLFKLQVICHWVVAGIIALAIW
jgi:hypothetical protein